MTLFEPPVSHVLTALLVLAGICAAIAGIRMMGTALGRGMRSASFEASAS